MKALSFRWIALLALLGLAASALAQETTKPAGSAQPSKTQPSKAQPAKTEPQHSPRKQVLVTISKETTVITEPLRKDGYVDYVAALNIRCKQGVTPENNAAVPFWQAMGPAEIEPEIRARFFKMLEIKPLPEKGDYYVSFSKYMQGLQDAHDPRLPKPSADGQDAIGDQLTEAMKRPWSRQEFPLIAEWLSRNEKPLVLVVEASRRPRRYDPLITSDKNHGLVLAAMLPATGPYRDTGRVLAARAMLRLKDGKLDAAWTDLLACHRMARLVGQGATLVDGLVAISMDRMACRGDEAVLQNVTLSAPQAAKMRQDLANLPSMPTMADKINVGERYMFLDCVGMISRGGFDSVMALAGGGGKPKKSESLTDMIARKSIDWDLILRQSNSWYDRVVSACRKPTWAEQCAELDKMNDEVEQLQKEAKDWKAQAAAVFAKGPRQAMSQRMENVLIGLLMSPVASCTQAEDRGKMQFEATRLGFALAGYRADHGAYPERLGDLAPHYVPRVPEDVFAADGTWHYRREGQGYLLYSVGPNGRDDDGRTMEDRKGDEHWDDITVRVH